MSMELSDRSAYIAGHVTPDVKELLRAEAEKTDESVSRIIEVAVIAELKRRGYIVEEAA